MLSLPRDQTLPFFTYGLLRPDELAYSQISQNVLYANRANVRGFVSVQDGLPVLKLEGEGNVPGFIIHFKQSAATDGYQAVCEFEPKANYKWDRVTTSDGEVANVLVWRQNAETRGSVGERLYRPCWTSAEDPVFNEGLRVVTNTIESEGKKSFHGPMATPEDWHRYFRCQMAYLLLFSAVERYLSLRYGMRLSPLEKETFLGKDDRFAKSIRSRPADLEPIWDARNPGVRPNIYAQNDPLKTAKYFFQVRHNIAHRGKGAWLEAEKVRKALSRMNEILLEMLTPSNQDLP